MIYTCTASGYLTKSNTPTLYVKIIPQASNVHASISFLTPRSCCYVPVAPAIASLESQGGMVYYALRGGNHVVHFRQSHWKKLVRGEIKGNNCSSRRPSTRMSSVLIVTILGPWFAAATIASNL